MTDLEVVDICMLRDGCWITRQDIEKWFKEQGWTRDDYVFYGTPYGMASHFGWMFRDPSKAVMFKLVWG